MKRKFLVITYDDDQQETFYDWICAESEEKAQEQVCEIRTYAVAVCAFEPDELRNTADKLSAASEHQIEAQLAELKRQEWSECDECGCLEPELHLCPDGSEVCDGCFPGH